MLFECTGTGTHPKCFVTAVSYNEAVTREKAHVCILLSCLANPKKISKNENDLSWIFKKKDEVFPSLLLRLQFSD
jgi:hypothetical protein